MNDEWKCNGAIKGRKEERARKQQERLREREERKRDGVICLISETTPMTEPFFISQSLYSVYVNPGGQTTAEECDHNLSI